MDENALHELSAAYALDALDADERDAYEAHLAHCERCRADLAWLSDTSGLLAYPAAGPAPPPGLRARILDAASAERANVVPLHRRRELVSWAVAGVAVAAAIALGVWASSLSNRVDSQRSALAAQRQAARVMADPGAQRIPLKGHTGTLVISSTGDAAVAVTHLPAAPSGKTYELWVIPHGGAPKPAGFLRGSGDVAAAVTLRVPRAGTVAATVEPAGGSAQPTSKPVFAADRLS